MTLRKDDRAATFSLPIPHLSADIAALDEHPNAVVPSAVSDDLKSSIAAEVHTQMVPVVSAIVHEVANEVRTVMAEMMTPLCDEIRTLWHYALLPNALLYPGGTMGIYMNGLSMYSTAATQNTWEAKMESCDEGGESSSPADRSQLYVDNNFSSKSQADYVREPKEPRAQASTSDCAAYSFIYYNTVCLVPIATLLDPSNEAFVCQKVPKIFLGKEGGKISFLVDMKAIRLRDLTSDNLGYWTSRFAVHMKTRKYFVKDGQIKGRIQHFGQMCRLLQDYDYILHRQYYCHGNTIGPAAIRKNIWYLTSKRNVGKVVGCALISYEIDDNATVKIPKFRYKPRGMNVLVKDEMGTEQMDINTVLNVNAEVQRCLDVMPTS